MVSTRDVVINNDGEATCGLCGKIIWQVPNKEAWIRAGRHPTHQTLLMTAHLNHLNKHHKNEW